MGIDALKKEKKSKLAMLDLMKADTNMRLLKLYPLLEDGKEDDIYEDKNKEAKPCTNSEKYIELLQLLTDIEQQTVSIKRNKNNSKFYEWIPIARKR